MMNTLSYRACAWAGIAILAAGSALALNPTKLLAEVAPEQQPLAPRGVTHTRVHVTIARMGLDVYARVATEIVHARVLASRTESPANRIPMTVYTVEILGAVKGHSGGNLEIRVGGTSGEGGTVDVSAAPRLRIGDEAVLFLWTPAQTGETGILGLSEGTYRITRSLDGTARVDGLHAHGERLSDFLDRVGDLLVPTPNVRSGGR